MVEAGGIFCKPLLKHGGQHALHKLGDDGRREIQAEKTPKMEETVGAGVLL
jgi:hypothetical protein